MILLAIQSPANFDASVVSLKRASDNMAPNWRLGTRIWLPFEAVGR